MDKFQQGYQTALQDVHNALMNGGIDAVVEWIDNNLPAIALDMND